MNEDAAVRGRIAGVLGARLEALQCLEITSAVELERALEGGDFDVALTGDRMGWSTGGEVLSRIHTRCPDAPVLMVTDDDDAAHAVEALRRGFSDYVLLRDLARLPAALLASLEQTQMMRQRTAELEQLRAATEHYRIAAKLSSDFAYTLRMSGPNQPPRLEWASGAFSRITGYNLVDVLNSGWKHFVDPRDLSIVLEQAERVAAGEPGVIEYRLMKADRMEESASHDVGR
jgi:CheY-like chemotaxis protein